MSRLALGVLVLAACSGDIGDRPDASVEPDAEAPGLNQVTLTAIEADYIRYQNGDGGWTTPAEVDGIYPLFVNEDYLVVVVCADSSGFDSRLVARTFTDGDSLSVVCGLEPSGATVQVSGQMTQPGEVWIDGSASSATGPWDFALDVPPGPHDLFAIGAGNVLIRRDQTFAADTTVPTIDVVADGTALTAIPFTLTGADAAEAIFTELQWFAASDFAIVAGTDTEILAPPVELLAGGDFQFLFIDAETATTLRSASAFFTGTQTAFTLLPVLTDITYAEDAGILRVSWGTIPTYTELSMSLSSPTSTKSVSASKRWMDATGRTFLAFDVTPPEYDPAWEVDLGAGYSRRFDVHDFSGTVGYSTGVREGVAGAALRVLRPRHLSRWYDRRHAMACTRGTAGCGVR